MADLAVIEVRLDNVETAVAKHDEIIQQLVQSQIESKTGLAKVATELEITNGLIASYMDSYQWNIWCQGVITRLNNIEKSLKTYQRLQKRMLYLILIGFVAVLGNGLLLYYK